jgi:hypothetical protein
MLLAEFVLGGRIEKFEVASSFRLAQVREVEADK